MQTALIVLPEKPDHILQLVGEYLTEKGYRVIECAYDLHSFRKSILKERIDYTFMDFSEDRTFDEITSFSRIQMPNNQFVIKFRKLPPRITDLINLNVSAFFGEVFSFQEIVICLKILSQGRKYTSEKIQKIISNSPLEADPNILKLTPTEQAIMAKLAPGKSMLTIADELFISIHTLHNHKTNIRKKLKLDSNRELIIKAMEFQHINSR
jgi:DNA-binding NarL/FixJ family response regulator